MGTYTVVWDVEDDVFGGRYSLQHTCDSYAEACEFAKELRNDDLVSNIEIYGQDDY